jgi:hypothetical protein
MLPNRDVRLYNFYPLVQASSFGQSVKERHSVRMLPVRDSLFSTTTSSSAPIISVPGSVLQAALRQAILWVRTVETVGARYV